MASSNRTNQINQVLKELQKRFKPTKPTDHTTVLDHLLFACCLENSPQEDAEKAFATLQEEFFDWNEVRVSTVRELAEAMKILVDPEDAAVRLKRTLQSLFESIYSFDLEALAKENLGKASEKIEKYPGTTPFMVAYVTQNALGGHAIPVNRGVLVAMNVFEVISEEELQKAAVPGLERAVPKTKGQDVASILHQFGVTVGRNPYSPAVRKLLVEIDPTCKERLPRRPSKKEKADTGSAGGSKKKADDQSKKANARGRSKKSPKKTSSGVTSDDQSRPAKKKSTTKGATAAKKKTKTASRRLAKSKPR